MRIHSIRAENYRPFAELAEIRLGSLATIVGKNDVGKSNILRALEVFFESGTQAALDRDDVHDTASEDADVVIEVAFDDLPRSIQLEEGVDTTLEEEMLVDANGHLRIRKTWSRENLGKFSIVVPTQDFQDERFSGVSALREKDLNKRCEDLGIDVKKSGRSITNKSKRGAIRTKATEEGIALGESGLAISVKDDLWKTLASILPEFHCFACDTRLGVGETTFQSQFRPVVNAAAADEEVIEARDGFTGAIGRALQGEVDKIFEHLRRHTDGLAGLTAKPKFAWDKAVSFDIFGKDLHGIEKSLERRGSGMRRLLMVAFFQYLAERPHAQGGNFVFAVEEPENCLHPGLQRELVASFRRLADEGYQVIITTHSAVFAGASPKEDLALVVRREGIATACQIPELDLSKVADELGVEPGDQITGYNACVFVEGEADITFWKEVVSKLKVNGTLEKDFEERKVGFIMCGGDSLKHWIDLRCMKRLNRRYALVVDSDRKSANQPLPARKVAWQRQCEQEGGLFFATRKREIENYLHPDAIARSRSASKPFDDYTDMKKEFGKNVVRVIADMTAGEILERDRYTDGDGNEHHELKEIAEALLALPGV